MMLKSIYIPACRLWFKDGFVFFTYLTIFTQLVVHLARSLLATVELVRNSTKIEIMQCSQENNEYLLILCIQLSFHGKNKMNIILKNVSLFIRLLDHKQMAETSERWSF